MKSNNDRQISGLAGEYFVAAELLKREIQTSITIGNAKAIDLMAYNTNTKKSFQIQVKTLREKNYFLIKREEIEDNFIYVFVLLNKPNIPVQYYIIKGNDLNTDQHRFGKGFFHATMPGILPENLSDFEDNWNIFE